MTVPMETSRPRSVPVVASGLAALAVGCVVAGVAVTGFSGCCGSPDAPDGTYALVGLVLGGSLGLAAAGLWAPFLPPWALLTLASGLPVVCAVAAPSSADLANLLPFAILGWIVYWWYLRRPRVAAWLRSRE